MKINMFVFLEHIQKHMADYNQDLENPNEFIFTPDFPMDKVLNEVKTEFEKYALWVEKVKKHLEQTSKTLDEAETRTRAVNRRLRGVENYLETSNDSKLAETPHQMIE